MLACLSAALCLAACGSSDDDNNGDPDAAPQPDAPAQVVNALGQLCDAQNPCPDSPAHTCVYLNIGSDVQGYCSPVCTDTPDCTEGYEGPATGELTCFTPNDAQACSIGCTVKEDCPADLDCVSTGGPMSFCTVPQ